MTHKGTEECEHKKIALMTFSIMLSYQSITLCLLENFGYDVPKKN